MNEHIKSLYPWARNYDKGGPIKRQNLLAGMKTPEQIASETMSVAENTKTQNEIDATEQRLQASKAQKERIQQQLSQKNAEIKPQNENPLHYASTNPLTQQIASLGYINEQNPQTWYRPGYDYQQQYFSPETREQAQNDISNFTSLLFGATFPEMLPFLAAYSGNELFNDDEQSKQDINTAINTAGFFAGGTHSVRDVFNRGKNVAKNTVEQVKLAKNFKPRQIAQEGDFVFEPFRGQDENLIGSVFYNKRDLQHKSGSKYGQKNILGRSLERVLRGGIKSDVYVEKSLMDQADLPNVTLNPLKKTNKGFKSTFGKDANPKDYYRISTEQLLTSKIPTNVTKQGVYDQISNQMLTQLKTKASKQTVPVFYNPKTIKRPGSILRGSLYGLPVANALGNIINTTSMGIGQWQDYKNMNERLQDTDYEDFQELYYNLPQQDRNNVSLIVSNYINNPYELETKEQFDALVDAFEQQYGEKGLKMLNAYVKYQTVNYSNPVQIHPVDATKSFVNDHIYQFNIDNEDQGNSYAKGGPKRDKFYNTQLTPQQEQQYQQWIQTLPINLRSDYDYDLRGAWLNGDLPDQNYHMTDKWKKPWHPTFSNESIYSTPEAEGGRWDGEEFHPSQYNNIMRAMGEYVRWGGNSFGPGGPFKRQNLLAGMKSPEEIAAGNSDTNVQTVPIVQTKPMVQRMLSDEQTKQVAQNVADIDAQRQGYANAVDKVEKEGNIAAVLAQQGEIIPAVTTSGNPINAYNYNMALYGRNALNPMSIGANYDFDRDRLEVDYIRQQQANNWENKYNRNYGMDNVIIPAMEFSPMFPWVEGVKAFKSASQKDLKSTIDHTALALTPFMFRRLNTLFKPINKITNNQLSNVIKNTSPSNNTWNDFVKKLQINQIIQSDMHSLPKYNLYDEGIDFTNRKLLDNIVDEAYQQIIPRLENDPFRQQSIVSKIKPSEFVRQNFNDLVDKASVVEWSKRLFDDYHRLFNSNVGGFALEDRPRIIVPKKDFHRTNRNPLTKEIVEFHELRHLLQKRFPRTDSEEQILKQAYSDVPQPLKYDGTIDTKYDMTKEWETINSEGRKLLLDASHYMYDPTKTAMENIAIQNKIIDKYDPRAMLIILKENGSGYWDQFITDIAKKKLSPAQQLDYIDKWKKAMQTVGMFTGVNAIDVNDLNDTYAKGGQIHIKSENRGKFTDAANRAGKSVQEYASQILANKDHYSTTLVKRANFAKNSKKFHH